MDAHFRDVAGRIVARDIGNVTFHWYTGMTHLAQAARGHFQPPTREPCPVCRPGAPCPNGKRMLDEERERKAAASKRRGR